MRLLIRVYMHVEHYLQRGPNNKNQVHSINNFTMINKCTSSLQATHVNVISVHNLAWVNSPTPPTPIPSHPHPPTQSSSPSLPFIEPQASEFLSIYKVTISTFSYNI